jgi:NADH-quinone oxidoreductase subunit H
MTFVEVLLAIIKILIVIMFLLNMAAVATWADRRQGAMVQDRVGPNRAVVQLPSTLARILVIGPPALLGVLAAQPLIGGLLGRAPQHPAQALDTLTLSIQLAVLVAWLTLIILCGMARASGPINSFETSLAKLDPRSIFYAGVGFHAFGFIAAATLARGGADQVLLTAKVTSGLLALVLFASGLYSASRVPDGGVPLRLAGTLHAAADAMKMVWKEDFIPKNADRFLHGLAPILAMFSALVAFATIPFGDKLCFLDNGDRVFELKDLSHVAPAMGREFQCSGFTVPLQIADLNMGLLYVFGIAGTGIVGAAIAGWASDNKFSLMGGLRAASQMVSYEVAMGLALIGIFMIYGSIQMAPMVDWQGENAWGIFVQPFGFILFITALAAETKRVPFDQPEGESEIVAGYFVEYSGMKWGMFMTGEYVELITSSALLVTLFLGGYHLPFLHRDGLTIAFGDTMLLQYKMNHTAVTVIGMLAFFGKTILMTWVQVFFRWTLPRFRYDQLMKLGWTRLLPLSIANMLVTGVVLLTIDSAGEGVKSGLKIAGDVTQGVVALGGLAAVVALIAGLLEPVERKKFIRSTAARFAQAAGGTKSSPQGA